MRANKLFSAVLSIWLLMLFGIGDAQANQLAGYTGVGINGNTGVFAKLDKNGGTGIAFVNIEDSQATVTLTAYDDDGNAVATEIKKLAANEKIVDLPENIFSQNISTATYVGYVSDKEVVGFQINGSSDGMMLDALPGFIGTNTTLYFPHVASNGTWETEICIINTGSQSLTGELKSYDKSGQEVATTYITLASHARREITVGYELPNPSTIEYTIFESDTQGACGYLKFYIDGKYRVAIPAASEVNSGDIYISHIASDDNWFTGVSILNTTSSSKVLTIEFNNGVTKTVTIPAKEHKALTIRELFGGVAQSAIQSAVIKNGSGIVGLEIFGTTDSNGSNYLSGILLKGDTTTNIYYPHIASNSTWWTGIVAYNPSVTSCELTISPYRSNGIALSSQSITLGGQEKYLGTVQQLNLPEATAWFSIEATSPITGFELFGINPNSIDNDRDGYTENQSDCNDSDTNINPGATDICGDGIDQDCSGADLECPTDPEDIDDDGDGYTENQGDCNDSDASINPGATDVCGDGVDQDCSGVDPECGKIQCCECKWTCRFVNPYGSGTATSSTKITTSSYFDDCEEECWDAAYSPSSDCVSDYEMIYARPCQ